MKSDQLRLMARIGGFGQEDAEAPLDAAGSPSYPSWTWAPLTGARALGMNAELLADGVEHSGTGEPTP
jgi:hypothetical protein